MEQYEFKRITKKITISCYYFNTSCLDSNALYQFFLKYHVEIHILPIPLFEAFFQK